MTVSDGIAFCQKHLGYPYSIRPSRFGYTNPVWFDCSGYAWRFCDEAGAPLPRNISTTFAMVAYAQDNPALGLVVTKDFALRNEGVLCLRGGRTPSGVNGSGGHMAISDGQGGTYEAKGTRYGVVRDVIGRRFDFFMVSPGWAAGGDSKPDDPELSEDEMARADSLLIQGQNALGKMEGPVYVWNVETHTKSGISSATQFERLVEIRAQLAFPNNVINPYPIDFVESIPTA